MMKKTLPCELKGYRRGFKGFAGTWGGSTATLYKTDDNNDVVVGTAVKMTMAEVEALDPFEAHPFKYLRQDVKVTAYNLNQETGLFTEPCELDTQAYIMREEVHNNWKGVPDAYKVACCKTMYTHRKLRGMGDNRDFVLPIYNAVTKKLEEEFEFKVDEQIEKEI